MSGKKAIIKTMFIIMGFGIFFLVMGGVMFFVAHNEAQLSLLHGGDREDIRIANMLSYIPGVFVLGIGVIIILGAVISAIGKLSMFKEENKVFGTIVDARENPNIIIDHKHPKKAICEITDPVTGSIRRVESADSKLDIFSMIGMNVPIYVHPKKRDKVFVDLENAGGEMKLAEGQQRVHDFRNL